jgi:8-oxo-dGTP diphosphatase
MTTAALAIVTDVRHPGRILCVWNRTYGTFGLPGGKVEPGEAEQTAVARELYEETGANPVLSTQVVRALGRLESASLYVWYFRVYGLDREPDGGLEGTSFAWLRPSELVATSGFSSDLRYAFTALGLLDEHGDTI